MQKWNQFIKIKGKKEGGDWYKMRFCFEIEHQSCKEWD